MRKLRPNPTGKILPLLFLILLAAFSLRGGEPGMAVPRPFKIAEGDASQTLRQFAQQSGEQLLFPADQVRGVRTRPVSGQFTPEQALHALVNNTELHATQDPASGAWVITRSSGEAAGSDPRSVAPRPLTPRPPGVPAVAAAPEAGDDLVLLSPFEVKSGADVGYKAGNSISATRMAVPLRNLPMNVTALTEAFIADQKAYDLYDVVKWAPGVHQDNVSPQGWIRYNIRGFTSAAVQRNGFSAFRFVDTTNIARVEVVKGPSSLLYGQINPGGVINYITKKPARTPALTLSASVGDQSYARGTLDATGPVPGTGGKLLYRAIAMRENIQQFHELFEGRKTLVAPSLTWRPTDATAVTVEYEHFDRRETMTPAGLITSFKQGTSRSPYLGVPWNFNYAGVGDFQEFASDALSVEFTAKLGEHVDFRGTYLDSYWDMEWRATGQGGTGLLTQAAIDAYYPPEAGLTPDDAMFRRNRWEHQWGGERVVQADVVTQAEGAGLKWRALVGTKHVFDTRYRAVQRNNPNVPGHMHYLRPWDLRDPSTWNRAVPFGLSALLPAVNMAASSSASSLHAVVSAQTRDEKLHVLAGYARHTLQNNPARDHLAGTATPASRRSADVPQIGALFRVTPALSTFLSYSESFLANGTLLRVNNVPTTPASPSVGRGWEGGFKLATPDDRVSGTLSFYRIRASPTGIVTVPTGIDSGGTTVFTDVQGGVQFSQGAEFELIFMPVPELQVMFGYSECDAVYRQHPIDRRLDGTHLVATPDRTVAVWGKYLPSRGPLKGFTFAGGINHVGAMSPFASNPTYRNPTYETIDMSVGYRFRAWAHRWTADLTVKNLTDERYVVSASSWGFPRHMMLTVSAQW